MSREKASLSLGLFLAAAIVTFGCLVIMQFLERPWFFVALVAMHGGIAMFIVSRKTFKSRGFDMQSYFRMEYIMLLPFLLLMFYTFASNAGLAEPLNSAKGSMVSVYSIICFAITFWNFRHMQHDARIQAAAASKQADADVAPEVA